MATSSISTLVKCLLVEITILMLLLNFGVENKVAGLKDVKLALQMKDDMPFCLRPCQGISDEDHCIKFCMGMGYDAGFCDHEAGEPPHNMCCCKAA
ncbi:hypothetical protein AgCh_032568 [Apium graveolens]